MLNGLFVFVVIASILLGASMGRMEEVTAAVLDSAGDAVTLAIGLVGVMAFFLGLMRVAEDGGLLRKIARAIGPIMQRLFPTVPVDHPAMSAMILNISSNMLGLGNAATPFGIRAIEELDKLNGSKGTATNAMVLFLAINTAGSQDAAGILLSTWFASGCATVVGVLMATMLSRIPFYKRTEPPVLSPQLTGDDDLKSRMSQGDKNGSDMSLVKTPTPTPSLSRRLAVVAFWCSSCSSFVIL